ncbi:MAG: DUF192 domain-containing protein [Acidimicrobiales bacterium]
MLARDSLRPLFVVALLLVAAAGCGSGGDGDGDSSSAGGVTTTLPAGSTALPTSPSSTPEAGPITTAATGVATTTAGGAATTGTPAPTSPPTTVRVRTPVAGFGQVAYRIQGSPAQRCALLAETDTQHARGLMNRTDLAGHDGMLFVFDSNTTGSFWMKDTIMPLSIAWFAAGGALVSTADMTPCVTATCPTYSPAGAYRYALEVQQGGLGALGIGPGAAISIGGACS